MKRFCATLVALFFVIAATAAVAQSSHDQHQAADKATVSADQANGKAKAGKPRRAAAKPAKAGMMGHGGGMDGNLMAVMMAHMTAAGRAGLGAGAIMDLAGGGQMAGCAMMGGQMAGMGGKLDLGELGLDEQQWTQVRALAHDGLKKMHDLRSQLCALCLEAAYLMSAPKVDEAALAQVMGKIGQQRAAIFLAGRAYLEGLRGILSPEQLARLEP